MRSRWTILAVLFAVRTAMAFQFQSVAAVRPCCQGIAVSVLVIVGISLIAVVYRAPRGSPAATTERSGYVPICPISPVSSA